MCPDRRVWTYERRVSSIATVPVVRIASSTDFTETEPNLTPMDCKRSGDSCTGASGVSVCCGEEAMELASCESGIAVDSFCALTCANGRRDFHQRPPRTATRAKLA